MIAKRLFQFGLLAVLSASAWGSTFSFFTTMRAGQTGPTWELGAGSTSATTESQTNYTPTWNLGAQNFQIGYNQTTGQGYVTVAAPVTGTLYTASFANPGPALTSDVNWTIAPSSFFVIANTPSGPSSISLTGLTFSSGVTILSGSLPSSFGTSHPGGSGGTVTNTASAPIVFNAAGSGGSWTIDGTVQFTAAGFVGTGGGASGNQMQFGFGASGTDTPETSSVFLIGAGLIALGCYRNRQRSSAVPKKEVAP